MKINEYWHGEELIAKKWRDVTLGVTVRDLGKIGVKNSVTYFMDVP